MDILIPAWVDGKLTKVEKLEAHERGLRHKAVSVFLVSGRQVLIQQRALSKYHTPGLWANACCTHPIWGEDPDICADRRLNEELGIMGVDLNHVAQIEYRADVGSNLIEHELVEVFVGKTQDDLSIDLNPQEVMAVRWIDIDELATEVATTPNNFTPWLKIYLETHRDLIFKGLGKT